MDCFARLIQASEKEKKKKKKRKEEKAMPYEDYQSDNTGGAAAGVGNGVRVYCWYSRYAPIASILESTG